MVRRLLSRDPEADIVVPLKLPAAAQAEIEAVAAYLDMSAGALMRRYIGEGLRQGPREVLPRTGALGGAGSVGEADGQRRG